MHGSDKVDLHSWSHWGEATAHGTPVFHVDEAVETHADAAEEAAEGTPAPRPTEASPASCQQHRRDRLSLVRHHGFPIHPNVRAYATTDGDAFVRMPVHALLFTDVRARVACGQGPDEAIWQEQII